METFRVLVLPSHPAKKREGPIESIESPKTPNYNINYFKCTIDLIPLGNLKNKNGLQKNTLFA